MSAPGFTLGGFKPSVLISVEASGTIHRRGPNTSGRYGLTAALSTWHAEMAGIGTSVSPLRGPAEVALSHHCGRSQPLMGAGSPFPVPGIRRPTWIGSGGWFWVIPDFLRL